MTESKWEARKMKNKHKLCTIDEIAIFALGFLIYTMEYFVVFRLYFIGVVILWYWFKLRKIEAKICLKKQEIYNVYYDKCRPVPLDFIIKETEKAREPLNYHLEILEFERKFLIDKFVVINLILFIVLEIFIKK